MQEQLDRIERKMDQVLDQQAENRAAIAANTTDLTWVKRIGGFVATALASMMAVVYKAKS